MKKKVCFKCGETKAITAFYKHPMMADGRLGKCKECAKIDVRANRIDKIDYYREYDHSRGMRPDRVKMRERYQATDAGKESIKKSKKKWLQNNIVKRSAHILIGNAVASGRIEKPDVCSVCMAGGRIHGHHDDYSRPLDVRWLCTKCHTDWHKEFGEAKQ